MPSYRFNSDGKEMTFTPGKNGSLTYKAEVNKPINFYSPKKRSKTISPQTEMNRKMLSKSLFKGF